MSTFLVVAHQIALSPELRDALLAKSAEDPRAIFTLLVPATPPEDLLDASGKDGIGIARRALEQAVDTLQEHGVKFARCSIGAANPLEAIAEEFERSRRTYDGVILCTLPFGYSRWLEQDLINRIESLFAVSVTHVLAATSGIRERQRLANDVRLVTFSVRLGAPGAAIARRVADCLGFRYYDWEITSEAAARAGVPPSVMADSERAQSLLSRVMDRLLVTGVYANDEELGRLSSTTMASAIATLSSREYRSFIERVVVEFGHQGEAVIVGHASQVILRYEPGTLKVLITGSVEGRAKLLAAEEGRTPEEALSLVADSDEERKSFFKQAYGVELLSAELYDLTLNLDRLSIEGAVDAIVRVAKSDSPATRSSRREAGDAIVRNPIQVHR
jgi:cytidylate kinase